MANRKLEKDLKQRQHELALELDDVNDKLNQIKEVQKFRRQIKANYRKNEVPIEYKIDYKQACLKFEQIIRDLGSINRSASTVFNRCIDEIYSECREPLPIDNSKIYNCPECGESNCLYIGSYGDDDYHMQYAVTCSHCDFVGPKISDYGEAWCEFESYLIKKGYIKDE